MRQEHDLTIKHVSAFLNAHPNSCTEVDRGWLHLRRANAYRALGKIEEALADLEKAREIKKEPAWFYARISDAYGNLGKIDEQLASLRIAEEVDPHYTWTYVKRMRVYAKMGLYEETLAEYDKFMKLAPHRSSQWYSSVAIYKIYVAQGKHRQALSVTDKAIELSPRFSPMYKRRAKTHFQLENFDDSLADLNKAIELSPEDLSALTWVSPNEALACPDEGFRAGYLALADKAVGLLPDSPRPLVIRARIRIAFGQDEEAEKDLDSASATIVRIENDEQVSRDDLSRDCVDVGVSFLELKRPEKTVELLSKARELGDNGPINWYRSALLHLGENDADQYRHICAKMLTAFAETESADEARWLAWTCALAPGSLADLSKVVAVAEVAVQSEPESIVYLITLGALLYRAGRAEEAVERMTRADKLMEEPDKAERISPAYNWYFLVMGHHALGQDDEAKQWLDKANEWTDKVLRDHDEGTAVLSWNRRLTLKLLREEAEGMIGREEG
uniref:Repeat-containing protein n=1 Tax=uncultured bacterium ws156A7 TaxID=1131828 RepID=I1X4S8_9BACT|nr:repeat-containing protein [uncultured bacterium ws156A7]